MPVYNQTIFPKASFLTEASNCTNRPHKVNTETKLLKKAITHYVLKELNLNKTDHSYLLYAGSSIKAKTFHMPSQIPNSKPAKATLPIPAPPSPSQSNSWKNTAARLAALTISAVIVNYFIRKGNLPSNQQPSKDSYTSDLLKKEFQTPFLTSIPPQFTDPLPYFKPAQPLFSSPLSNHSLNEKPTNFPRQQTPAQEKLYQQLDLRNFFILTAFRETATTRQTPSSQQQDIYKAPNTPQPHAHHELTHTQSNFGTCPAPRDAFALVPRAITLSLSCDKQPPSTCSVGSESQSDETPKKTHLLASAALLAFGTLLYQIKHRFFSKTDDSNFSGNSGGRLEEDDPFSSTPSGTEEKQERHSQPDSSGANPGSKKQKENPFRKQPEPDHLETTTTDTSTADRNEKSSNDLPRKPKPKRDRRTKTEKRQQFHQPPEATDTQSFSTQVTTRPVIATTAPRPVDLNLVKPKTTPKEPDLHEEIKLYTKQLKTKDYSCLIPNQREHIPLCSIFGGIKNAQQLAALKTLISKIPNDFLIPLTREAFKIKDIYFCSEICAALIDKLSTEQIGATNANDQTLVHLAAMHVDIPHLLEKLRQKGAPLDAVDKTGRTAIYYAAELKKTNNFIFLKQRGAKLWLNPLSLKSIESFTTAAYNLALFNALSMQPAPTNLDLLISANKQSLSFDTDKTATIFPPAVSSSELPAALPTVPTRKRDADEISLPPSVPSETPDSRPPAAEDLIQLYVDANYGNCPSNLQDAYRLAVAKEDGFLLAMLISAEIPPQKQEEHVLSAIERMQGIKEYLKRKYLISNSYNIRSDSEFANFLRSTAYQLAVENNDMPLLSMLISEKVTYHEENPDVLTAIKAMTHAIAELKSYIEEHELCPFISVAQLHKEGDPLRAAIYKDDLTLFRLLLAAGADVAQCDKNGNSVLMAACESVKLQACHLLIQSGLSLTQANDDGKTPLEVLLSLIEEPETALPLSDSADIKAFIKEQSGKTDQKGQALLHYAVVNKHKRMVEILIACGADRQITDKLGYPLLIFAIMHDAPYAIIKLLIDEATANQPDREGRLPLHYAVDRGMMLTSTGKSTDCLQVITRLLEKGADPTASVTVADKRREKGIYSKTHYNISSLPNRDLLIPLPYDKLPSTHTNKKSPLEHVKVEYVSYIKRFLNLLENKTRDKMQEVNVCASVVLLESIMQMLKTATWKKEAFTKEELEVFELIKDETFIQHNTSEFARFLCLHPLSYAIEKNNIDLIEKLLSAKAVIMDAVYEYVKTYYKLSDTQQFAEFISQDPYKLAVQNRDKKLVRLLCSKIAIPKEYENNEWIYIAHTAQTERWKQLNFTPQEKVICNYLLEQGLIESEEKFSRFLSAEPYLSVLDWNKKFLVSLLLQAQIVNNSIDNEEVDLAIEQAQRWENYDFNEEELTIFNSMKSEHLISPQEADKKGFADFLNCDPYGWVVNKDSLSKEIKAKLISLLIDASIINTNTSDAVLDAINDEMNRSSDESQESFSTSYEDSGSDDAEVNLNALISSLNGLDTPSDFDETESGSGSAETDDSQKSSGGSGNSSSEND